MKKILLLAFIAISVTACGNEEVILDLDKINEEVTSVTTGEVNIQGVDLDNLGVFGQMNYIYDFDFEDTFNLDSSIITEYNVRMSEDKKELMAIFKTTDEDELTVVMDKYLEDYDNAEMYEFEGYIIYIASSDNAIVLDAIKSSEPLIYNSMLDLSNEQISDILNINVEDLEEYIIKLPAMATSAFTFMVVNPVDEKFDEVKEALDTYFSSQEDMWSTYLPDQYEYMKNRKEEVLGEYLVYIVSTNNDLVYDIVSE